VAVAPNGALFLAEEYDTVRRISAAMRPLSGAATATAAPVERMVTTLIGADRGVQFARSAGDSFRQRLAAPRAMALHVPPALTASAAGADADADRDVGCLYVGCDDGVHAFDLAEGKRKQFPLPLIGMTALTVSEDGARLFAVSPPVIHVIDTHRQVSHGDGGRFASKVLRD
jgi:hypothetical protein